MITEEVSAENLFADLDKTWNELLELISSVNEQSFNAIPFTDSWTVAQLAVHVSKSNNAIAQGLNMEGKPAGRKADEGVSRLKKTFLNFDTKFQSPEFIVPENKIYDKQEVIGKLTMSIHRLMGLRTATDLAEIIHLKIFGDITKLELLHFVVFHTQRHIHQLKNIIKHIRQHSNS